MKEWKPCLQHTIRSAWNDSFEVHCPVCELIRLQKLEKRVRQLAKSDGQQATRQDLRLMLADFPPRA